MLGWARANTSGIRARVIRTLDDAAIAIGDLRVFAQASAEFLAEVARLPIAQGKLMTVAVDASTLPNYFAHGLDRPFRGVIVLGQSDASGAVYAWDPQTLVDNGADPSSVFMLRFTAASAVNVTVWVM